MLRSLSNRLLAKMTRPFEAQLSAIQMNLAHQLEKQQVCLSRLEALRRKSGISTDNIHDLEYCVFSQFGDDGIIEYLTSKVPTYLRTFIEFGVEDYTESNTRLLLMRDNWQGLVMDGSERDIQKIRHANYFWKHELTATCAFITSENVNQLISDAGFNGQVGLLSIDVDGVDYWLWEAISIVDPLIVICEYNSVFGSDSKVTVPYDPEFVRLEKHYTGLYAGASLPALVHLATQKNLRFIGCNSAGNNAYFVHNSLDIPFPTLEPREGYVRSKFREARDQQGGLALRTGHDLLCELEDLPLVNVETQEVLPLGRALNSNV